MVQGYACHGRVVAVHASLGGKPLSRATLCPQRWALAGFAFLGRFASGWGGRVPGGRHEGQSGAGLEPTWTLYELRRQPPRAW